MFQLYEVLKRYRTVLTVLLAAVGFEIFAQPQYLPRLLQMDALICGQMMAQLTAVGFVTAGYIMYRISPPSEVRKHVMEAFFISSAASIPVIGLNLQHANWLLDVVLVASILIAFGCGIWFFYQSDMTSAT